MFRKPRKKIEWNDNLFHIIKENEVEAKKESKLNNTSWQKIFYDKVRDRWPTDIDLPAKHT